MTLNDNSKQNRGSRRQFDTKPTTCPGCHNNLNQVVEVQDTGRTEPKPGDLTVCFRCGTALQFDDQTRPTIVITPEMLATLPRVQVEILHTAQYHLAAFHKASQN